MIIGFAGKAASGKTTTARFLKAEYERQGFKAEILPMAQALRDEVSQFLYQAGAGENINLLYGNQKEKITPFFVPTTAAVNACPDWPDFRMKNADLQLEMAGAAKTVVTVRLLLQWWGTDYRRNQNPVYWTQAWKKRAAELIDNGTDIVLVDDVRFPNEVDAVQGMNGFLVKIERDGCNGANAHVSERMLDDFSDWDHILLNNSTLGDLESHIIALERSGRFQPSMLQSVANI